MVDKIIRYIEALIDDFNLGSSSSSSSRSSSQ